MPTSSQRARAWLVLARCSNLPTVWSNVLAGACLGGWWFDGEAGRALAWLLPGTSALYTAGMFLNDVCDVEFDTRHRPERPIPAGLVSRRSALAAGAGLLAAGGGLLAALGLTPALLAAALAALIVVYDWLHKRTAAGLALMAGCRLLLYPLAASALADGPAAGAWRQGLLLAAYVFGLSSLARLEHLPARRPPRWPWLLIALPVAADAILAWHRGGGRLVLVAPLAFWLGRLAFGRRGPFGAPRVAGLLAGIVLVDLAAVAAGASVLPWLGWFAVLFGLALAFQRFVPAT